MIFCNLCKREIPGYVNQLRKHITMFHGIAIGTGSSPSCSNFVCGQSGCSFVFSLFSSLRRHIIKFHPPSDITHTEFEPPSVSTNKNAIETVQFEQASVIKPIVQSILPNDIHFFVKKSICELKSDSKLTKATVERFVDTCESVTTNVADFLRDNLMQFLKDSNISLDDDKTQNLLNSFNSVPSLFEKIKTSEQQKRFIASFVDYNDPLHIKLGTRVENVTINGEEIQKEVDETFAYISIIKTLQALVKNTEIRKMIHTETPNENGIITSYKDGKQFKTHNFFQKFPYALRLTIYYDDVEITNPLGTKCKTHEVGLFYFTIQNTYSNFNSNINNIFIFTVAHTLDIKKYSFNEILKPFIEELKLLEDDNGIEIMLENNELYTLRASLVNFVGDSKAAHEVFEFLSCSSNMFCRFCMISRNQFKNDPVGTIYQKRTPSTHLQQLKQLELQEIKPKDVGFRSDSVLNKSKYFHCASNFRFDPMHDLNEGVVQMTVKHCLKYFVEQKKITVKCLNDEIHSFKYGIVEKTNKPSANFTLSMLTNNDNSIKQYAIQSWVLLRALPFILHSKVSFTETEHMHLLHLLEKILEIVYSLEISKHMLNQLDEYIFHFDRLFTKLFPLVNKINKMHHLLHYVECIEESGPIVINSCVRYETKHQPVKKQFQSSGNFKNVTKSIADRQIFKQNLYLFNGIKTLNDITSTSIKFVSRENCLSCQFLPDSGECVQKLLNVSIDFIKYQPKHVVQIENPDSIYPNFLKIIEIIKFSEKVFFFCLYYKVIEYNDNLNSFEVEESDSNYCFIEPSELCDPKPISIWMLKSGNKKFLKIKTYIF